MRRLLLPVAMLAIAGAVAGCGGSDDGSGDGTTATTSSSTTTPGAAISVFRVPTEVACASPQAQVRVAWTAEGADDVTFSVDGASVPEPGVDAASGATTVPVPCDDARHEIVLTARGAGGNVSEAAEVGTVVRPVARPRPAITRLSAPATQACTGDSADVTVLWVTTGADTVSIAVDGGTVSDDAGRALSGSAAVPVPCDDAVHRIVLTAFGAGTAAATHAVDVRTVREPPAGTPAITTMQAPAEVGCTGAQAMVPVRWATENVQAVSFAVDDEPVPANAGEPVSGDGDVPVPCDGSDHRITLTGAARDGDDVSHSLIVHAVPDAPPVTRPAIVRLTMPTRVGCAAGADEAQVRVAWRTRNATGVRFMLDGQPVGTPAPLPANGTGALPVPCDGDRHRFTLVADSTGNSEAQVRRPISAVATGGGTTTATPTQTLPATAP